MGPSRKIVVVGIGFFLLATLTLSHLFNTRLYGSEMTGKNNILLRDLKYPGIHQDDDRLYRFISDHVILLPPTAGPLILDSSDKMYFSQVDQDKKIDGILGGKRNGFFVEVGGADGESHSNSLFFERERDWTGLLIEPHPFFYRKLLGKNRNAYSVEGCVSMTNRTHSLSLQLEGEMTTFVDNNRHKHVPTSHLFRAQCYPLWAILRAIGRTHVDMLSLDVEGAEVDVLRTIPFDKLSIDVLTIEYKRHGDSAEFTKKHRESIANVMAGTGKYKKVAEARPFDDIYQLIT